MECTAMYKIRNKEIRKELRIFSVQKLRKERTSDGCNIFMSPGKIPEQHIPIVYTKR
jgi:hypothetical protein